MVADPAILPPSRTHAFRWAAFARVPRPGRPLGVVTVGEGPAADAPPKRTRRYALAEVREPAGGVRTFRFTKPGGDEAYVTRYGPRPADCSCECIAFEKSRCCVHIQALAALTLVGQLHLGE